MPDADHASLRQDYQKPPLDEANAWPDPFAGFDAWFQEAVDAGVAEPNAMTLATVAPDGSPRARVVLLKGVQGDAGRRGFTFFTNYGSAKAKELNAQPRCALNFWWEPLARCVRVEGVAQKVSRGESEAYFATRPRGSQLGAWASRQSSVIEGRGVLEEPLAAVTRRFEGREVDCPPRWGGYLVVPGVVEFWQGQPNRLHDRLRYRREARGWVLERLSP